MTSLKSSASVKKLKAVSHIDDALKREFMLPVISVDDGAYYSIFSIGIGKCYQGISNLY